jgi:hypothetical protein
VEEEEEEEESGSSAQATVECGGCGQLAANGLQTEQKIGCFGSKHPW